MANSGCFTRSTLLVLVCSTFVEVQSGGKKIKIINKIDEFKTTLEELQNLWSKNQPCEVLKPASKKLFTEAGLIAAHLAERAKGLLKDQEVLPKLGGTSKDTWEFARRISSNQDVSTKDLAALTLLDNLFSYAICNKIKAEVAVGCYEAGGDWFIVFIFKGKWAKALYIATLPRKGLILGQMEKMQEYSNELRVVELNAFKNNGMIVYYEGVLVDKTSYIVLWSIEEAAIQKPSRMLDYLDTSLKDILQKGNDTAKTLYIDVLKLQPSIRSSAFGSDQQDCVVFYFNKA